MAEVEDGLWYYQALHAHMARSLCAVVRDKPAKILDAGCGTGGLIRRLAPGCSAWTWTGVDLSPLACALARLRCTARIVEGSITAMPFETVSFDAVTCADVLYHIKDDQSALRELHRVLRPGGVAVINVPAHPWLWSYHDIAVHGERRYTRRDLRRKIELAGFSVVRITHWNAFLLPLIALRRKCWPAPRGGSDVKASSPGMAVFFGSVMKLEAAWLKRGAGFACGSSLLAICIKNASTEISTSA